MKNILGIFSLFFSLTTVAQKASKKTDRFAGLDTAFARILKDWKAAGFAVAVVEKNKVVYAKGFGFKDWEAKLPVTENTQFAIGSCTKAFTASLIGLLAKDGKVDVDKPVKNYLPALNFFNNEMNNNVTLRDMMSHRTGVSRYDYSWYFFPSRSRDSLMQRIQYMEPSEPLRKKWQYNNFMYLLQGVVVEKLSGKSWEDNIREKIFTTLGMTNSTVTLAEWMKASDLAVGYDVRKDRIHKAEYYDISGMAPAGSINSSVLDMAKWVSMWIQSGKHKDKEILPAAFVAEAISSQMVVTGALPSVERPDMFMSNYGLGWMLTSYRGHYRVEHGGNINGFSASTSFFPSDSIGIIVLCNQDGSSVPTMVRNLLSDRMLGLPYRDWHTLAFSADTSGKNKAAAAMKSVVSDRKYGTKPSHLLKDYEGIYSSAGKESFEISLQNDSLFMTVPNEKLYLRHYHFDIFNLWDKNDLADNDSDNVQGLKIMFDMDERADISSASMPLEGTAKPILFTKTEKAKTLPRDSLEKYVGDYTLNGTTVKVYIKGEKTLFVFVPGQPEYELMATEKNKFKLISLTGFSVEFKGNAKGEIGEIVFIQPNGSFKAARVVKL
ncbi:MAG: serine hydrolase [Gloeobacteraceae cyanobacterium ES-bin-316]|nr:serine hydrolase [Ferruginibacter sp.]